MAELIQCDRCGDTVAGKVKLPNYALYQGISVGVTAPSDPGGPTVAGWELVRGNKLFCPSCVAALDRFVAEPLPKKAP